MRRLMMIGMACCASTALAAGMDSQKDAGKDHARDKQGQIEAAPLDNNSVYNVPGYQDNDWGSFDDAEGIVAGAPDLAATDPNSAFVTNSHLHRPTVDTSRNDSFMQRGFEILRSPNEELLDGLSSEYGDCEAKEYSSPAGEVTYGMQCDRTRPLEDESCTHRQVVEADADYNYQCDRVRRKENRTCDEWLEVSASQTWACDGPHGTFPEGNVLFSLPYNPPAGFLMTCNSTGTSATVAFYESSGGPLDMRNTPPKWTATIDPRSNFNLTGRQGPDTYSSCSGSSCVWSVRDDKGGMVRNKSYNLVANVQVHETWKDNCAALEAIAR